MFQIIEGPARLGIDAFSDCSLGINPYLSGHPDDFPYTYRLGKLHPFINLFRARGVH